MSQADNRRGEIAYALVKYLFRRVGLTLERSKVKEELGKISETTGIPVDELMTFGRRVVKDVTDEVFSFPE